jgi:hypothetical protein
MPWYFRAVERDDGRWTCRHGRRDYDSHPELAHAVEHLRHLAAEIGDAAEFFVHFIDGRVERVPE